MKKLFGALVVGTMVFGAVMASAAALNVNSGNIQVGTDTSLACDTDGVDVTWQTNQHGQTTSVTVSGVNDVACNGEQLFVFALNQFGAVIGASSTTLAGAPGDPLPYGPAIITTGTTSYKLGLGQTDNDISNAGGMPAGVDASLIEGVRVMID